jgi:hypothetical protein
MELDKVNDGSPRTEVRDCVKDSTVRKLEG